MDVGELKAALDAYPDSMSAAVVCGHSGDLDLDPAIATAIHHPGVRPRGGADWHWESDDGPDGTPVVVIY